MVGVLKRIYLHFRLMVTAPNGSKHLNSCTNGSLERHRMRFQTRSLGHHLLRLRTFCSYIDLLKVNSIITFMNVSLPPFVQDPEKGATLDLTIEDMDDEPIVIEEFMHA